jgi:hypothetical protein
MKEISQLHQDAMSLIDDSAFAKLKGEAEKAKVFLREAFEKEKRAAELVAPYITLEPTRSVLHRSAATMALDCGEIREAERLISIALSGDPPFEIAEELRDLLEDVYFKRHYDIRDTQLEESEFQFTMTGDAIGFGKVRNVHFIDRVKDVEKLIQRTHDRLYNQPFQERGRPKNDIDVFISVPKAASFAVSFTVGYLKQGNLPGLGVGEQIVSELLPCLELFESGNNDDLIKKIPNPSYFRNFIGLARNISPDGINIRTVGFTSIQRGVKNQVVLTKPKKQLPVCELPVTEDVASKPIQVIGMLRYADARHGNEGEIQIIAEDGKAYRIRVPEGMMSDIVRPMWDYKVLVYGTTDGRIITLKDIEKAS